MYNNQLEDIKKLQRFDTLDDFNESFYIAMKKHRDAFSKGELIALKTLKNWGAKIVGVVYAKIGTIISDLIKRKGEMYAPSRSTFERAIRKAKKLGIIRTIETKQGSKSERRRNLKGNNLFIFELFSDSEQLTERKDTQLTERENAETPHNQAVQMPEIEGDALKTLYTSKNTLSSLRKKRDSSYVQSYVPRFLVNKLKPFYDSADIIEDCFLNAVHIMDSYHKGGYEFVTKANFEAFANEAINALVRKERKLSEYGQSVRRPVGYFTNAFKQIVEDAAMNELIEAEENAPVY
ncbi:hypothetical protein ACQR3P_31915 [Rhodococcus sp. IEGM1300]